jgi:hypothetical protein
MTEPKQGDKVTDRLIRIFVSVSVVLNVALIGVMAWLVVENNSLSNAQHQSDISQCQVNNTARVQDIAIWNRLLRVPASAPASVQKEKNQLERLVKIKDTPHNCAKVFAK